MSISPADLRPGQRVRITRRACNGEWSITWESRVVKCGNHSVYLVGIGPVTTDPLVWNDVYTHTIEVIE